MSMDLMATRCGFKFSIDPSGEAHVTDSFGHQLPTGCSSGYHYVDVSISPSLTGVDEAACASSHAMSLASLETKEIQGQDVVKADDDMRM
eukprot:scaffold25941_cov23-Prasinocladus_malaysianus.AAC.2